MIFKRKKRNPWKIAAFIASETIKGAFFSYSIGWIFFRGEDGKYPSRKVLFGASTLLGFGNALGSYLKKDEKDEKGD